MTDPLQQILAAENAARAHIEATRKELDEKLRETRLQATGIRSRNEQRTREAVERAESRCVAESMSVIDRMDTEVNRQLTFDEASIHRQLNELVRDRVDRFWPD